MKNPDLDYGLQSSICTAVSGLANGTGRPAKNLIINYKIFITLFLWEKSYFWLWYPKNNFSDSS